MRHITRFGRFARPTPLDEMPQLFCIVLGDMQWFGPRPYPKERIPEELLQEYISDVLSKTKPGLFSWSVLDRGIATESFLTPAHIKMDSYNIRHRSVLSNIRLLFATVVAIIGFYPTKLYDKNILYQSSQLDLDIYKRHREDVSLWIQQPEQLGIYL